MDNRKRKALLWALGLACFLTICNLLSVTGSSQSAVVINEIQYHPASDDHGEEYVELYNAGPATVDLSGWEFSDGIHYTFPGGVSIPPHLIQDDASQVVGLSPLGGQLNGTISLPQCTLQLTCISMAVSSLQMCA